MINITETQLRQIIKEETEQFLDEVDWAALGQKAKGLGKAAIKGAGDLAVGTAKVAGKVGKHLGTGVGDAVGGAIGPSKQQQQQQIQQAQQQGQQLIQQLSTMQWSPEMVAAVSQALQGRGQNESINRANVKKLASECKKSGKVKIVKQRVAPIIVEV